MTIAQTLPPGPAQAAAPARARLAELDGVRALSILAVLAGHMLPLGPSRFTLNETSATVGMSLFFALSGFLITRFLWDRPAIGTFLVRRVARIAPSIALFTVLYCGLLFGRWDTVAATNLYVLNYVDTVFFAGMTPLWSIAVEMHFYVAIALAVLVFGRRGFWLVPVGLAAVLLLRAQAGAFADIRTHLRIDEILSGALLALVWLNADHRWAHPLATWLPRLFWPILVVWLASCHPDAMPLGLLRPYLAAGIIGSVLFMGDGWQRHVLSWRAFGYVAAISFALYVWHSPFRVGWFAGDSTVDRYLVKRPLGIAAMVAVAHVSTFHFEKRFTDWAHRITARRGPPDRALARGP